MESVDEFQLYSFTHPDFLEELLIVCRNPPLAIRKAAMLQSMLNSTVTELAKIRGMVGRGRSRSKESIGVRVSKVVHKSKLSKHFTLEFKVELL